MLRIPDKLTEEKPKPSKKTLEEILLSPPKAIITIDEIKKNRKELSDMAEK